MNKLLLVFLFLPLISCNQSEIHSTDPHNITGQWRGILQSPGGDLPFGIEITEKNGSYTTKFINGSERVDTSITTFENNKLTITIAWFDAVIQANMQDGGTKLSGIWKKTASGQNKSSSLAFTASRGYEHRFTQEVSHAKISAVTGSWKVIFSDENSDSKAVAEFSQQGQIVTGTFLTATGDYRYLAGVANDGKLFLSAFDGAHAFLFEADINGDKISNGHFWSRESYHATWKANKSDDISGYLQNSWEMNKATKKVEFSFENITGKNVSLTDERFKNKAVLINLFGTWCPNCNDEAPVLAKLYDQYNSKGLEIVGLAFEFTEDKQRDIKQLGIFKKRHSINYPLLLAGGNDKSNATKVLGFIDKVKSYPTTLFLDRNHDVIKINTGFSGPGTGDHYTQLVIELEDEIKKLLN